MQAAARIAILTRVVMYCVRIAPPDECLCRIYTSLPEEHPDFCAAA
jgi:hypothetical protein